MNILFTWTEDHKRNSIGRVHFDALHGRVPLALRRLADLARIFPEDSDLALAEGVVRLDYLGQGLAARELFEKTYHWDHKNAAGAKNATLAARSAEEFQEWAEIALAPTPQDQRFQEQVEMIREYLKDGRSFWEILLLRAGIAGQHSDFGTAAALVELALISVGEMGAEHELVARRVRAKNLRELDKTAANRRLGLLEPLQPDERLALKDAVAEMTEVLRLDEYDPEMWNFKAAWCVLLQRFDEAEICADRALSLRPHGYPKPLVNKANSRLKQKKYGEALDLAEQALRVAQGTQYLSDIPLVQGIIKQATHPPEPLGSDNLSGFAGQFVRIAEAVSDEEIGGQGPVYKLVNGVLLRLMDLESSLGAAAVMAELTADFSPETVSRILAGARNRDPDLFEVALLGLLYAAVQSQGALQRDAARVLALTTLRAGRVAAIRTWYRHLIQVPAASHPELSPLFVLVLEELRRIHVALPDLIAHQPSNIMVEIQQFLQPTGKFGKLPPFSVRLSPPRFPVKFVGLFVLGAALVIWAVYHFFSGR
jgi:tetratricopeptide (TPR) repeat protein